MDFDANQLFSSWDSKESIAALFFMIIAFLFGYLIAYLLRSRRIRRLNKELKELKKKLTDAEVEIAGLKEQLDLKEADLKKAAFELEESEAKINRLEGEKAKLYNQILAVNSDLEKIQATNKSYAATIEDLNNQILGLKTKNDQLSTEIESEEDTTNDLAQIQSIYNATRSRLEDMEGKLTVIAGENQNLRKELDELKENAGVSAPADERAPVSIAFVTPEEGDPKFDVKPDKSVLKDKIIVEEHAKDDLTMINGVGPFIAQKLNEIGVFTYEDVSAWDAAEINRITEAIGYFPRRIERDDWVGQAAKLARVKKVDPESLKQKAAHPTNKEDLKIVEGIGPKIETLLKEAGIMNWQDLAETKTEQLQEILSTAGDRYRMHDPGTWAAQASLAANSEWALLKEYQEELKGGREVKE